MRRLIALPAALTVVAAAVILAGCGEDSEVSAEAPPGTPAFAGEPDAEAFEEFQECLREEGIDSPRLRIGPGDPPVEPPERPDPPSEEELEAIEECGEDLPGDVLGGGPGGAPGFETPAPPPGG